MAKAGAARGISRAEAMKVGDRFCTVCGAEIEVIEVKEKFFLAYGPNGMGVFCYSKDGKKLPRGGTDPFDLAAEASDGS